MHYYAQLNESNICIGISSLSGEIENAKMVKVDDFSQEYLWKKHEDGAWSNEKFEPQTTAPISEFEQLKADKEQQAQKIEMLELMVAELGLQVGGGL